MTQGNSGPPPGPPPGNPPAPDPGTTISFPMTDPSGNLATYTNAERDAVPAPPYNTVIFNIEAGEHQMYTAEGWVAVPLPRAILVSLLASYVPPHDHPLRAHSHDDYMKSFLSDTGYTFDAEHSVTHDLGVVPKGVELILECTAADLGYSVGDLVVYPEQSDHLVYDLTSTTLKIYVEEAEIFVKDTAGRCNGRSGDIDTSKWQIKVSAWG